MKLRYISLVLLLLAAALCLAACGKCDHEFQKVGITPASCTAEGSINHACSKCGEERHEPISKLDHNYDGGKVTKEPSCTAEGERTFTCSGCNDSYTEAIAKLEHTYDESTVTKEPTCTAEGEKTFTCTGCGQAQTEAIPMIDHAYGEGVVTTWPNCTTEGVRTFTCSCGDSYTEAIEKAAHTHDGGKVTKEPTCTAEGEKAFTCTGCGDTYTEAIAKTAHSYSSKVTTEATCTKDGIKTFTCSGCGDSYTEAVTATGHNYSGKVTTEATCTKDGVKTFTCANCNDSYTEKIDGGHKWKDATCTAPKTCSTCKQTSGDALGHDYAEATATAPMTCRRCGDTVGKPMVWYEAGMYKVGTDIPAGEYYVCATTNYGCYICVSSDSNGKNILENENFDTLHYITVENGQYLEVKRGKFTSVDGFETAFDPSYVIEGMYRVGIDIPAGEYKLSQDSTYSGYYCIYDNSTVDRDIQANDNFDNTSYVTVRKGQYLLLNRCYATLVSEIQDEPGSGGSGAGNEPEEDEDESLWTFSEASDLNGYSQDAFDEMGKGVEYVTKAMSNRNQTYKVMYYSYAVTYAQRTRVYLEKMKTLADNNAELTLTNSDYASLQEMITYTYDLCGTISTLDITADNYELYADELKNTSMEVYTLCLGIQKITVDLMKAFT